MTNTQEPNQHTTAIVLLNYNGRALLEQFLPQIVATPHAEVYVADNNSSDDSLAFLQQHYADTVHIIALERNYGFAEGYNIALRQICATYYVLLNTDVAVTAGWLQPLIATLEADATLAAVQPKIRAYSSPTLFEYAGGAGGYLDVLGYPLCRGRIFDTLEADTGQYDAAVACAWASGACMAVRARTFHAFGGFDGSFFAHMEEIDWCWRVRRAGFGIMAQPASLVYHIGGGTLPANSPRKNYLNFRNSLITLAKNETAAKLCWLLPLRLVLDGVAGARFLMQGQPRNVLMIVWAHWYFFAHFLVILRQRTQTALTIKNNRIGAPRTEGVLAQSIVWAFFVRGIQQFSGLF